MTPNMGLYDRAGRILAAVALIWAAFGSAMAESGALHWLALAVAAIFVVTALAGRCPLYSLFGLKTCRSC